jgi:heme A synthase
MNSSPVVEPASVGKQNPWVHRYAVVVAVCTLLLIITGAMVTSNEPVLTSSSQSSLKPEATMGVSLERVHQVAGHSFVVLPLALVLWLTRGRAAKWLRLAGWATLAALILEIVLGEQAVLRRMSGMTSFSHAYMAQLFFVCTVAIAVFTSPGWNRQPDVVEDRFSIRMLSLLVPVLALLQVALGAAYRHQAMGVLTHIFGALVVAVFVLLVGVLVVKQYPGHRSLQPAAVTLMSLTGLQVLLGFAAFLTRLMTNQATPPVVISTVAHVATGALTLAASVVLTIQIRRNVRAAQPNWAESSPETLPS